MEIGKKFFFAISSIILSLVGTTVLIILDYSPYSPPLTFVKYLEILLSGVVIVFTLLGMVAIYYLLTIFSNKVNIRKNAIYIVILFVIASWAGCSFSHFPNSSRMICESSIFGAYFVFGIIGIVYFLMKILSQKKEN